MLEDSDIFSLEKFLKIGQPILLQLSSNNAQNRLNRLGSIYANDIEGKTTRQ